MVGYSNGGLCNHFTAALELYFSHSYGLIVKFDVGSNSEKTVTHFTIKALHHSTSRNV